MSHAPLAHQRVVEVCVDSADGLAAAIEGGADRIELCSALGLGGLTPSPGLMALAARASVPVYAMVRPRAGDFVYSAADLDTMRHEIDAIRHHGLAGVVLGANVRDGALDTHTLAQLCAHAQGLGTTLHRAFDLVPALAPALEAAVQLGFERILTSGRALSALQGLDDLQACVELAAGRISIMPGAGLTPENLPALLERIAVHEVHGSCSLPVACTDARAVQMGFSSPTERHTSAEQVRRFKAAFRVA